MMKHNHIMKKHLKILLFFALLTIPCLKGFMQSPQLIEFGWDIPYVDQLSKGLPAMQNTPFDGICFSFQPGVMEAFDTTVRYDDYFQTKKLHALQWGKYKNNFILLLGYGITGGRWYDDEAWKVFTRNMEALSKAMSAKGIRGVLFDAEYYLPDPLYNPWTFTKKQYPNQSFEEVQSMVKKRGIQFIRALQKNRANFSFLAIWLTSLVIQDLANKPMSEARQALLPAFMEGVLEGKNKTVKIIDGNEHAYWYIKPSQFLESSENLNTNTAKLMKSQKAKLAARQIELAHPVFFDGLMGMAPDFETGRDNINKWKWVESNIKYAMASSDEFVWFYSQRINWWKGGVNDTLVQILKRCKLDFNAPSLFNDKNATSVKQAAHKAITVNTGKGYYYSNQSKSPWKTDKEAFTFKWISSTKNLQINFVDKVPESISVYTNIGSAKLNHPKGSVIRLKLSNFINGKIMVLAKYPEYVESFGSLNYKGR